MSHLFQSTRPVWGATGSARADWLQERLFQSTRPVWGATKGFIFYRRNNIFQSTRPVWGATLLDKVMRKNDKNFNPRAPCGARLALIVTIVLLVATFQSTRPVWGATTCILARPNTWRKFQSTRPVWGATELAGYTAKPSFISIHAPRVGRDHRDDVFGILAAVFQSTRPVWGATLRGTRPISR